MNKKYKQKIVTFGGGTGQYHLLSGLRELNQNDLITAVAGNWDSGGSSGILRSEIGILPPGDIRRCILALMQDEKQRKVAQQLFDDRLKDLTGPLKGHSFGNLLTARLDNLYSGQDRGVRAECDLFRISAKVMPVSLSKVELIAETNKGNQIIGETNIDLRVKNKKYDPNDKIVRIYFDTSSDINPELVTEIKNAEKIVFSQGDLYTSVLPHLLVSGVAEAISKSKAKVIVVLNLMTKPGETDNYKASDFLQIINYYLDVPNRINYLIVNENHLDKKIIKIYNQEGQNLIQVDDLNIYKILPKIKIIKKPVSVYLKKEHLLRHDPINLAEAILSI